MACLHATFTAYVAVNRLEAEHAFNADIRIRCVDCGTPFQFMGVQPGLSATEPMSSPDFETLHVPIAPRGETVGTYRGFRIIMDE